MNFNQLEYTIQSFAYDFIQILINASHGYWVLVFAMFGGVLICIGISPLKSSGQTTSAGMIAIVLRNVIFRASLLLLLVPLVLSGLIVIANKDHTLWFGFTSTITFYWSLIKEQWVVLGLVVSLAVVGRVVWFRTLAPRLSAVLHRSRKLQKTDSHSDIRDEVALHNAKDFVPSDYYSDQGIFLGLDEHNQPDYIPFETWREVSMQLIGPSRYGKGVLLGCLMDQIIRNNDGLVYIDPKADKWAAHVMYQAAKATGRAFYYLALHDDGPGSWAPFAGGTKREGFTRLCTAFGLEYTKDAGTDFYKSQEIAELEGALESTRSIAGLYELLKGNEQTLRINAELKRWLETQSLCPAEETSQFFIEQAIKENAVVYVQGSLDDAVVTTATKVFITEYLQTARKLSLRHERPGHLTMIVDEVSFLVSNILSQALAANLGFDVNFVLAYQSPGDLFNSNDKNAKSIAQSITSNSQVKVMYGSRDPESAELVSKLSGTVTKTVLRAEGTEIDPVTGGETWQHKRSMTQQEAPLIHTNTMYALPPRVCAVFKPQALPKIQYTAHVPVTSREVLFEYLQSFQGMTKPDEVRAPVIEEQQSMSDNDSDDEHRPQSEDARQDQNLEACILIGTVVSFGDAPYKHGEDASVSFYVEITLESEKLKTVWSIDFKQAFADLAIAIGDQIWLERIGQIPIQIEETVSLSDGATEVQTITKQRNKWDVRLLKKAKVQSVQDKRRERKHRKKKSEKVV